MIFFSVVEILPILVALRRRNLQSLTEVADLSEEGRHVDLLHQSSTAGRTLDDILSVVSSVHNRQQLQYSRVSTFNSDHPMAFDNGYAASNHGGQTSNGSVLIGSGGSATSLDTLSEENYKDPRTSSLDIPKRSWLSWLGW